MRKVVCVMLMAAALQGARSEEQLATDEATNAPTRSREEVSTPPQSQTAHPYGKMYGSVSDATSNIGQALYQIEEIENATEEALKQIPEEKKQFYKALLGGKETSGTAREDKLSTKSRERIKRAKARKQEIRKHVQEGLF